MQGSPHMAGSVPPTLLDQPPTWLDQALAESGECPSAGIPPISLDLALADLGGHPSTGIPPCVGTGWAGT